MKLSRLVAAGAATAMLLGAGVATASATTGTTSGRGTDTSFSARVKVADHVVSTKTRKHVRVDVYYTRHGGTSMKYDGSNYLTVESRKGYYYDYIQLKRDSSTHEHAYVPVRADDPVGTYDVGVSSSMEIRYHDRYLGNTWDYAYADDDTVAKFSVRRNSVLAVNASPEPVRKNHKVTVKGRLRHLASNGYSMKLRPTAKKQVRIYFNPAGKKPQHYVTSARTTGKGTFAKKIKQKVTGTWTVKYTGTATYAPDHASDKVKVRR